jgi:hypothetical protein
VLSRRAHNVALLIGAGADIRAKTDAGLGVFELAEQAKQYFTSRPLAEYLLKGCPGTPPPALLKQAVSEKSPLLIALLARCGADLDAEKGAAVLDAVKSHQPQLVRELLEQGADPMAGGGRAVDAALCSGMRDMVTPFIEAGMSRGFIRQRLGHIALENPQALQSHHCQRVLAEILPPGGDDPPVPPKPRQPRHKTERLEGMRQGREKLFPKP